MDPSNLVLNTVGLMQLIQPICKNIHASLESYRGFGRDSERLRLRFAVQRARLESLERVLFDDGKFTPAMPGKVIDHLPRRTCEDLLGLFRQLYEVLAKYAALRAQYFSEQESDDDAQKDLLGPGDATLPPGETMGNLMKNLVIEGKKSDSARQKAAGWARKVMWVTMDRSSTEQFIDEFERWTGQAQALLEAAWWPLSFFETIERMRTLEKDDDVREVGLLRGIDVRKVLVAPLAMIPRETLPLELGSMDFRATSKIYGLGAPISKKHVAPLEFGYLQQGPMHSNNQDAALKGVNTSVGTAASSCVVEYRYYGIDGAGSDEIVRQMVVKFAALLHVGPPSDEALRLLPHCMGFFQDVQTSRFGLVYSTSTMSSSPPSPPATLASLLDAGAKRHTKSSASSRSSLCARMQLAKELAIFVHRLHAYQWLHKSLRSDNVLFLAASPALENPRVVGFGYARQAGDESEQIVDDEARRNIYRHPDRWGASPVRFGEVHDIYGEFSLLSVHP